MSSGSGGSGQTSSMTDGNNISTPDTPDEVMEEAIPVDAEQLTIIRSGSTLNDNVEVDDAYAGAVNKKQQLMDAGMDLERQDATRRGFAIPSTADEIKEANARWGEDAWQMKALRFINSDGVQRFLIFLLVLDVLILFTELAIDAFVPSCKFVIRDAISCCPSKYDDKYEASYEDAKNETHRFLGGGGGEEICTYPLTETEYPAGCDYNKHHGVHVAHVALFWTTVAILSIFEVELLFLIYLIGPKSFFGHLTYVIDFVVVSLSLSLELAFRYASDDAIGALPGLLIFFRLWRFVRIGHGLVQSTYESQERKIHLAVEYIDELEEKLERYEQVAPNRPKKLKKSIEHHSSRSLSTSRHRGEPEDNNIRNEWQQSGRRERAHIGKNNA